jgi:hypothetical protein
MKLSRRRLLLAASLAGAIGPLRSLRAQDTLRVEGGKPHRLPSRAVDDLEIELAAGDGDEVNDIAVLTLGALELPSGRLAVADGVEPEAGMLAQAVPPGRYPFQLVIARFLDGSERVAFAQVKFADRPASNWTNALFEDDTAPPEADELSGYEVNSGFGSLFDAQALQTWRGAITREASLLGQLEAALRGNQRPGWSWARVVAPSGSGYIVSAGLGEGFYGSYWGRDSEGVVVSLVTDFDLLDWAGLPEEPPVTI